MRRGWRRRIRLRDERCARREEARREEARGSRRGRVRAVPTVTGRVRVLRGPADAWGHRRASRQSSRPMISRSRSRALRMRALTADSVEQVIAATSSVECPNTKASDMASC